MLPSGIRWPFEAYHKSRQKRCNRIRGAKLDRSWLIVVWVRRARGHTWLYRAKTPPNMPNGLNETFSQQRRLRTRPTCSRCDWCRVFPGDKKPKTIEDFGRLSCGTPHRHENLLTKTTKVRCPFWNNRADYIRFQARLPPTHQGHNVCNSPRSHNNNHWPPIVAAELMESAKIP